MKNFYTLLLCGLLSCFGNGLAGQNIGLSLSDVNGNVGETICVDLVGTNFNGVVGMQFSLSFDTLVVRFVSATGSINGNNVSFGFQQRRPNQLRVNYSPFSTVGYTDPGPFVIGQICFEILQDIETEIMFADTPIPLEFTTDQGEIFEFNDVDLDDGIINMGNVGNATCDDGIMNGSETGVDCGGPDCAPCMTMPTCDDGIMNGSETGVDCGGPDCAACPSCDDGIMNGSETGVDCGGPDCAPCMTMPTCDDGVMNGDETGIDCGGSCAPCMTDPTCGEGSSLLNLCVSEVCNIAIGAQACVELSVANFTDITGLQMDLKYPAANLNYASFTPNTALGGGLQVNEFADGEVRLVFFRSADSPVSLDDNDVFATICFTNETLNPTILDADRLRVTNTAGMVVGPVANDGSVNDCGTTMPTCNDGVQNGSETGVDCGGPDCMPCATPTCDDGIQNGNETGIDCGGSCAPCMAEVCGAGSSEFNICVSEICDVAVGAQGCVDLTVANFTDITAVQLNVLYPGANLEFASFTPNPALADGLQVNEFADGEIRMVFFRSADSPETLTDGDTFVTLCFTNETANPTILDADNPRVTNTNGMVVGPIANDGSINNCPDEPTCSDGIMNGSETGVDCGGPDCAACPDPTCDDGIMNGSETGIDCGGPDCPDCPVANCGEGSSFFNMCVGEACNVAVGAQACVDLTVANFNSITGVQMELLYPAANLNYSSFTPNAALADGLQVNEFADGEVRLVFFRSADSPVTLNDGDVFATICFTNETTNVTIVDADGLRVTNTTGMVAGPIANDGMVNGCAMPTCSDGIQNGNETGVDCGGPDCAACPNPTCDDGIQNGSETGVDCGGPDCPVCPTCTDGIQNGDETGIDCGGSCMPCMAECGEGTTDPEICIGSECADAGAEVCVPVFIANFDNLFGFQFSLAYAGANLEYTRFTAAPALQNGTTAGSPSDGTVNLIWNDPDLVGISFPADEMAFELCFTVQAVAATPITFRDEANTLRFFNATGTRIPGSGSPGAVNQNCTSDPTCDDGIMNGNETGVDCGGPDCPACETCDDGIQNNGETGVDCGGPNCMSCDPETCMDGIQNNGETGIDCGGPNCAPCDVAACGEGSSLLNVCVNAGCNGGIGSETCIDLTVRNFTDVTGLQMDLKYPAGNLNYTSFTPNTALGGGLQVNEFADGEVRLVFFRSADSPVSLEDDVVFATICFTNETAGSTLMDADRLRVTNTTGMVIGPVANDGTIEACMTGPTCDDGVMNGNETGVDCGGPDCPACETCNDGIMNNGETGIDCGGPNCAACPTNSLSLDVEDGMAQIGQQVCVDVMVADFTNIANVGLTLNFNTSVLSLASVTANSSLAGFGSGNFNTSTAGQVVVDYTPAMAQSLANGEPLFTICFNVVTGDETQITITNAAATNNGGTNLTVNTSPGTINAGGVVTYDEFTMVASNETAAQGTQVCVDINVFNLEDLAGLQFAIGYDVTKLEYVSGMGTGQLPNLQVANPEPGILRVIWFDPNVGSNSVPDGESILTVCFNVLVACETPVEFTEQLPQFRIRATNSNNQSVPVDLVDGSVNSGEPCGGGPQNLILDLGDGEAPLGQEVCLDLKATNFTSLTDLSFSLTYDASKVTFTRATNFGLASITAANVSSPAVGQVVFDWSAPGSTGQSLAPAATVVSLCFTVDRFSVAPVNFANFPTPILARNASNQPVGVVPSGGVINPNVPNVNRLTLQIGSTEAAVDDEICLPVIAYMATDLVSFQYTINYDPTKLEYLGTGTDFAFNALSSGSVNNSQPGVLRVAWADPTASPNSVPDGTAIFYICFRVLATDATLVSFGDAPTAIEFEDVDDIVQADLLNGQVNGTPAPVIVEADLDNPNCFGGNDGSIALTVSGGNGLTYQWSPNVSSSATATNLTAGEYCVTVTNPNTNQATSDCFTIIDPGPFSIEVDLVQGVTCFGAADGQISIATIGNTGPYLFDWSGNLPDGSPTQNMLAGGTYSVTVTDDNGCTRSLENIGVGEPAELNIVGQRINITDTPGGVNVEIVGGSSPFRYAWSGPNDYTSDQDDILDALDPGTYCLTVTDNNNCMDVQCFAVIQALAVASTEIDSGCAGENNGSIDLTIEGGIGGYTYQWTSADDPMFAESTQDLDNLAPGEYNVTITSGMDQVVQTITVEEPTQIVLPGMVTNATMGSNGAIVVTPSGGNPPYVFRWDDGDTNQNRTNLSSGEYCLTATDASQCTRTRCYIVGAAAPVISFVQTRPASCAGGTDGVIRIVMTNGVAPITVRLEPTGTQVVVDTTSFEVNAPVGTVSVFLTDDQGVTLDTMVTVTGPDPITVNPTVTSDTEDTNCSGRISLEIEGGTSPYLVSWSNEATGATISQLCAGTYAATITDANGCTFETANIEVSRMDEEVASITDVACADGTEGAIDVTISGGVMPYTYSWTRTGEMEVISMMEDLAPDDVPGGIATGDYTLTVLDATGAMLVRNYTVGITAGFSVTTTVTSNYNGFGVSCAGASDGRIVITISGQGLYTYEFLLDGQMVGIDSVLENAAPGVYTVTVLDEGNCEISETIEVSAPPAVGIQAEVVDVSCGSTNDGMITLNPTGGVAPFSYSWSNSSTTPRLSGLGGGTYGVTIMDANGCTAAASYTLEAPEDLAITLEPTDATDGCNGSVLILPLGGSGNYRYTWPQLPNQGNNPFAEGLCPGDYTVEVTDDNECQTVVMIATVLDRRFPCLSAREVISPNGDGLNENFILFCSEGDEAINNTLQVFNRWGQLVYEVEDYDCSSDDRGLTCFNGRTNDGTILPEGPYYYIFDFTNLQGEPMQQRGSLTIVRD